MPDRPSVTELKVSGHLMRLDRGLYCVFHRPGEHGVDPATGLPGVRVSLPPGAPRGASTVEISGFRADGWISSDQDAALIRVNDGPAEVLVTVYQSAKGAAGAPHLEIVRLGNGSRSTSESGARSASRIPAPPEIDPAVPGVLAHVQDTGDLHAPFGQWVGRRGSRRWIEGFELDPPAGLAADQLEYQAALGHDWVTPWSRAGQFCGSRHMALPILGLTVRLGKETASRFECATLASFTDGSVVGPVGPGERCAAASLAPLEALQVILRPRPEARARPTSPRVPASSKATTSPAGTPRALEPDGADPKRRSSRSRVAAARK